MTIELLNTIHGIKYADKNMERLATVRDTLNYMYIISLTTRQFSDEDFEQIIVNIENSRPK